MEFVDGIIDSIALTLGMVVLIAIGCIWLVVIGIALVNLPYWIGPVGGSLRLWKWVPPEEQYQQAEAGISLLEQGRQGLTRHGRWDLKYAKDSLARSRASRGVRAKLELERAVKFLREAVEEAHPELITGLNSILDGAS